MNKLMVQYLKVWDAHCKSCSSVEYSDHMSMLGPQHAGQPGSGEEGQSCFGVVQSDWAKCKYGLDHITCLCSVVQREVNPSPKSF